MLTFKILIIFVNNIFSMLLFSKENVWRGPHKTGVSLTNAHAPTNRYHVQHITSAAEMTSLWRYVSNCLRSESHGNVTTENIFSALLTRHYTVSGSLRCIFSKCCLVTIKGIHWIILLADMSVCLSPLATRFILQCDNWQYCGAETVTRW